MDLERELIAESRGKHASVALTQENPETGQHEVVCLQAMRRMSFDHIAAASDVIQNLRSSLDHLANQLVLTAGKSPTRHTCFPIAENVAADERDKARKVEGMRSEAVEAIDRIKPYGGGNDFLWRLHEWNIIDKHKLLLTVDEETVFQDDWLGNTRGMDTFFMKTSQPNFAGVFDREVEDQIQFELGKALGKSEVSKGDALLPTLHQLVDVVECLVFSFKPLLQR